MTRRSFLARGLASIFMIGINTGEPQQAKSLVVASDGEVQLTVDSGLPEIHITSQGNVGLADTSPSAILHIHTEGKTEWQSS